MNEKIYYSAEDIAKMLGVNMGKSYKILREMNKELAGKVFLTIAGKIPVEYFREKWYGGAKRWVHELQCKTRSKRNVAYPVPVDRLDGNQEKITEARI